MPFAATLEGIGAGLSGLGSIFNYFSQKKANDTNLQIARETNQANLDLYNKQFSDTYKLWKENNAYNDPSAQMSRLKAAGLNPTLNMGSNPTGIAQAATAPSANAMIGAHMEAPMVNYSDVATSINAISDAIKKSSEAKGIQINNQYIAQEKVQQINHLMALNEEAMANARKGSSEWEYLQVQRKYLEGQYKMFAETFPEQKQSFALDNQVKQAQKEMLAAQMRSYNSESAYKDSLKALNDTEGTYRARQLQKGIDLLISQVGLNNAQADYYKEEKHVKEELKRLTGLQADELNKIMPYVMPRVQSEIYHNSMGQGSVKIGPFGFGGPATAYDEMFESPDERKKRLNTQHSNYRKAHKSDYDTYGNGD